MMKITGERKAAAARLAEITGERDVYTRVPRCVYEVGPFAIERDGSVTASESADLAPLRKLAQEGLLEGWEEPVEKVPKRRRKPPRRRRKPPWRQRTPQGRLTAEASTEPQETTTEAQEDEPDRLTISLPLTGHTENSLRNLVTMVYSRGSLISKATGGTFSCTLAQVDTLKDCITISDLLTRITPDLIGLTISPDTITFTGFPFTEDADRIKAFTQLAAQMNKLAKEQKRTMAKIVDTTNEKYIFRIWLLALGMGGEEFEKDVLSLNQEFFGGVPNKPEFKARIIHGEYKGGIIEEYMGFCRIWDENVLKANTPEERQQAVTATIDLCIQKCYLVKYLEVHRPEVEKITMTMFSPEYVKMTSERTEKIKSDISVLRFVTLTSQNG